MTYNKELVRLFQKEGYEIYLVGGCVRDKIMGIAPHDYDFCTNATPMQMQRLCSKYQLFHTNVGIKHGTIVIYDENMTPFEVTTYRTDGDYSDGRHPDTVCFTSSLEEDLARRDFTINAIAMNPITEKLIDPFGGEEDIKNGILRCVGNPNDRLREDALRILRGLRFAIKYELSIETKTGDAMIINSPLLSNVSKERKTEELRKMMTCQKPANPYFLVYRDILAEVLPGLEQCFDFKQNNKWHKHDVYHHMVAVYDNCKSDEFPVKLAALLHDIGKPKAYVEDEYGNGHFYGHPEDSKAICEEIFQKHLALSRKEKDTALALIANHDVEIAATKHSVRRMLNRFGEELFQKLLLVKAADRADHNVLPGFRYSSMDEICEIYKNIKEEESCFSLKDLSVSGKDIMEYFQVAPGKEVGQLLNMALEAVMDGKAENTKDSLLAFLDEERAQKQIDR